MLRIVALVWPLYSAVRLWRNGKRRNAISLALMAAARRFGARWWQYATIPLFAGAVGWFTNKVAVEMIFAPLEFWGLPLKRWPNQPLGWIGWQGIVPCKVRSRAIESPKRLDLFAAPKPSPPRFVSRGGAGGCDGEPAHRYRHNEAA